MGRDMCHCSVDLHPPLDVQDTGWLTNIVGNDIVRDPFHVNWSIILFDRSSGLSFSSLGLRPRLDVQEKGWLTTIVGHDMVRDVFHVGLSLYTLPVFDLDSTSKTKISG